MSLNKIYIFIFINLCDLQDNSKTDNIKKLNFHNKIPKIGVQDCNGKRCRAQAKTLYFILLITKDRQAAVIGRDLICSRSYQLSLQYISKLVMRQRRTYESLTNGYIILFLTL